MIKVKATGLFNRAHNLKWLKGKLNNKFILEYDSPNPDYLIYNIFDEKDLTEKYRNIDAIRIALFTENEYPDMNAADYFVANFHINYFDRYFKMNIFFWQNFKEINAMRLGVLYRPIRKKFCAAVISNCEEGFTFRIDFINKLKL